MNIQEQKNIAPVTDQQRGNRKNCKKISQITEIKNFRIFRDFKWNENIPNFSKYNVFYGWNGSGKTTLSLLFEHLQNKHNISQGAVEFLLSDQKKLSGGNIVSESADIPPVRVFNRNFITSVVESVDIGGNVGFIHVIGKKNIDAWKKKERLEEKIGGIKDEIKTVDKELNDAIKARGTMYSGKAREIKSRFSLKSSNYTSYDKSRLENDLEAIGKLMPHLSPLSQEDKENLSRTTEYRKCQEISTVSSKFPDISGMPDKVLNLAKQRIASQTIQALVDDSEVGRWVEEGLRLHVDEKHKSDICRFCENPIREDRLKALDAHFDDSFRRLDKDIYNMLEKVENIKKHLQKSDVFSVNVAYFYENLKKDAEAAFSDVNQIINNAVSMLKQLHALLSEKKKAPFLVPEIPADIAVDRDFNGDLKKSVDNINRIITEHERVRLNWEKAKEDACVRLVVDVILEMFPDIEKMEANEATIAKKKQNLNNTHALLKESVKSVEGEIDDHQAIAKYLNDRLVGYLGHNDLHFKVEEKGYALVRDEEGALNISDGERTAVAFLYFLGTLQEETENECIVVIDDPVSSLDSRSLLSAFSYMRGCVEKFHQVFLLTHSFTFFNQIKKWLKNDDATQYYFMSSSVHNGKRNAQIIELPHLLKKYQSDYHFLFQEILNVSREPSSPDNLMKYRHIPNMARRLLETFLQNKFPEMQGRSFGVMFSKLKKVNDDDRNFLNRLLNMYSHSLEDDDLANDPMMLADIPEAMRRVISVIKAVDEEHYDSLMSVVT